MKGINGLNGHTLFRLIAVPSKRSGTENTAESGTIPGDLISENRWFRNSVLRIAGYQASTRHIAHAPTVLVMVRDGRVIIERDGGWMTSLEAAGQSTIILEDEHYRIRNGGQQTSDIVFVEVR